MEINYRNIGMSLLIGIVFAFCVFIVSDYQGSLALGLALAFLNYKIDRTKEEIMEKARK